MIRTLNQLQPWALFFVRLALGVAMVYNGYGKVIPPEGFHHGNDLSAAQHFSDFVVKLGMPRWLGYVSAATEFFGGIFITLGLFTRFFALFVTGNMIVALVAVNVHKGYTGSQYTLALITMAFMLFCAGSGAASLDRKLGLL